MPLQASLALSTFTTAVRWAAWCPLNNLGNTEHCLQLMGGAGTNPDSVFMFHSQAAAEQLGSTSSMVGPTGGAGALAFTFMHQPKVGRELPSN